MPISSPTDSPTQAPTPTTDGAYCGCSQCTQAVWDSLACNDNLGGCHTCGNRISYVESINGGNTDNACHTVVSQFPDGPCGVCNPDTCDVTEEPTRSPTPPPTPEPTHVSTSNPTKIPTQEPTPTTDGTHCGCSQCTQAVWDSLACDDSLGGCHTCGNRISYVESINGGNTDNACHTVASQFPDGPCGVCNPDTCNVIAEPTRSPTPPPTPEPTPVSTSNPTKISTQEPTPIPEPAYCSCSQCTQAVWDTLACDDSLGGCHTCGSRISYVQSTNGGNNEEACKTVSEQFSTGPCGVCNPLLCNDLVLNEPDPTKLIWSDEFNADGAPDPSKWNYDLGDGCNIGLCGWGNNELQYYTSDNAVVANGVLRISAKKESVGGLDYTSARMVTRGNQAFRYGRIQFRARTAGCTARGTWPALWLLPEEWVYGGWPNSGEIDVKEAVGYEENKFHGSVHTGAYNHGIGTQKTASVNKSELDWHVFEIDWQEDKILFAINGEVFFTFAPDDLTDSVKWPFNQDFHLILNIAVGGMWGGVEGVDAAAFEGDGQYMEVDWVRVYSS